MNEVKPTNSVPALSGLPSAETPKTSRVSGNRDVPTGKELPATKESGKGTPAKESVAAQQAQLEEAVAKLNDYVQSTQRDLNFNVDDATGMTVVTVVDRETEEVIRQIPEEVVLNLARKLNDEEPLRLFSAQA